MARRNDDDYEPKDDADDLGPARAGEPETRMDVIRNFVRNSPWVVISVAVHVGVIAILALSYVGTQRAKSDAPPVVMNLKQVKEQEEPPPPEEKIDRKAIPENQEAEVVTFDENV